jgi:hypothetical protein
MLIPDKKRICRSMTVVIEQALEWTLNAPWRAEITHINVPWLYVARPTPCSTSSRLHFRKMCFMTLPLAVLGSSSGTPSSPMNQTQAGVFYMTISQR